MDELQSFISLMRILGVAVTIGLTIITIMLAIIIDVLKDIRNKLHEKEKKEKFNFRRD